MASFSSLVFSAALNSRFPKIGELPYLLTLAPRGFFWFQLIKDEDEKEDRA